MRRLAFPVLGLLALASWLAGCPLEGSEDDGFYAADDDATLAGDDDTVVSDDDDAMPGDDDTAVSDDDDAIPGDDDDSQHHVDCDLAWVQGRVVRGSELPPIQGALKVEVAAYEIDAVEPEFLPVPERLDIDVMYTPGPLMDETDGYQWRLCVEPGEVAIIVILDVNWDDDAMTPGDYLGHAVGTVLPDGSGRFDVVLDHILTDEECVH